MVTQTAIADREYAIGAGSGAAATISVDRRLARAHAVTDPQVVISAKRANALPKRAMDLVIAVLALIFLSPILLTAALLVKLNDGGPVFFGHRRAGRHGRQFQCWKFRSMAVNADEILRRHFKEYPEALVEWRATQKLRDDPRVTRIGWFLRATSIDELPQLFNVLLGEMSIVGPRPVPRAELNERYGKDRRYYLLVRPGITGLWQVSGRSNTTYQRRVALDREYATGWTLAKDVQIILKTIPAVLKSEGAR